ncbi:hypothetical protein IQ252_17295 [Tychonema sp. LEGE 07203]|nr:hypothetical protein [Tychonema sp. LEGE 07203]
MAVGSWQLTRKQLTRKQLVVVSEQSTANSQPSTANNQQRTANRQLLTNVTDCCKKSGKSDLDCPNPLICMLVSCIVMLAARGINYF